MIGEESEDKEELGKGSIIPSKLENISQLSGNKLIYH